MMMRYLLPVIFLCCLLGARGGDLVSIGYDDGIVDDGLWVDNGRGHAVLFKAPSNNWTLSQVAINGKLNPQMDQGLFVLEIWDQDLNLVYSRADSPGSYFGPEMRWAVIDVPDLHVSGDFYLIFRRYNMRKKQFFRQFYTTLLYIMWGTIVYFFLAESGHTTKMAL